jgi:hypothetical protein
MQKLTKGTMPFPSDVIEELEFGAVVKLLEEAEPSPVVSIREICIGDSMALL